MNEQTVIEAEQRLCTLKVLRDIIVENIEGARLVCECLGVKKDDFYTAIQSFEGAHESVTEVSRKRKNSHF